MARKATGEVRLVGGIWTTRVRINSKRVPFDLPACRDEDEAKARSTLLSGLAKRFKSANASEKDRDDAMKAVAAASARSLKVALSYCEELLGGELDDIGAQAATFQKVGEQWTTGELAKLYPDHVRAKDHGDDEARLKLLSGLDVGGVTLGEIPVDRVTLDHAEQAMRQLPESARRPATRRHYAQVIHRVLALAIYPLRIMGTHPLPRGFMPKTGKPPAFSYLYPADDAALMACTEVPLNDRVLFGFLDREGPRAGEATALPIAAFDLERGAIRLDENKTDDPRTWALDPGVARALRAYVERCRADAKPTDLMFVDAEGEPYDPSKLADRLRTALRLAKVHETRPELFDTTEARSRLRAHDLRGTFVTLSLASGRTETWVADRTGHRSSQMINRYRRAARSATELALGPLAPLDQAIPALRRLARECPTSGSAGQRNETQLNETATLSRSGGMADAADSKSASRKGVSVQVRPSVPAAKRLDSRSAERTRRPGVGQVSDSSDVPRSEPWQGGGGHPPPPSQQAGAHGRERGEAGLRYTQSRSRRRKNPIRRVRCRNIRRRWRPCLPSALAERCRPRAPTSLRQPPRHPTVRHSRSRSSTAKRMPLPGPKCSSYLHSARNPHPTL
jgi:hypothetical protein